MFDTLRSPNALNRAERTSDERDAVEVGALAIDVDPRIQTVELRIGADVTETRIASKRLLQLIGPGVQLAAVYALQHVLVLALRNATAKTQVLYGLEVRVRPGLVGQSSLRSWSSRTGIAGRVRFGLEIDEKTPGVVVDAGDHGIDRGVFQKQGRDALKVVGNAVHRGIVGGLYHALNLTDVLLRKEPFGDGDE